MASAFLTLLAGAIVLLCFYLYRTYTYWQRNGIPVGKGYVPIAGHILSVIFMRRSIKDVIQKIYDDHKQHSMVGFYKTTKPVLIVREPALVKVVMQSKFSNFHQNGMKIEPDMDPLLAKNPFFIYGEEWSAGRKRLTYAFSNVRLKTLFTAVSGVCKKFEDFLNRRLKSSNKYEVELKYLFSKFTGEVVANAGLGIEGLCFEDKVHPNAFDEISRSIFKPNALQGFLTMIMLFLPHLNRLFKMSFIPKEMDRFFRRIVAENLELRRTESVPRNDFLQLMIELEKSGEKLDVDSITSHALSFYVDGIESSSITLSFIGYHLALHTDIQEKLRDEVNAKIAKYDGVLTFDALKEMTYMEQVISESQRDFPVLTFLNKICTEEFELQGSDGLTFRAKPGNEILIPVYALQHDPNYWTNPDDFDPERFNEERKHSIEKMTFLPFGEGPRICVGMRMAMLQVKAGLATLLRSYKIELSPKTKSPIKLSPSYFLTSPVGGIWVYLSKL
ncbi:Cytochrome P450 9e2 [Habropoda laboriosa]|uniref:Cytochrome P450 9e2 n=1 Tax=Habropoda laboriosa TaxID=597456 RepID=A0A0L7R261_9HYME|nr:PREDICTED: cytochrome P450 9e2-like isoform X1 [Habropoda laboriosa]KOC64924.1 Cytochrome P450 9e2 [Habropoda laboriosa]